MRVRRGVGRPVGSPIMALDGETVCLVF